MVMSRDRNTGRIHNINNDNSSFERVEELRYLGTTLTDQNSIQEEIKNKLKSGNACYPSVQNLLSSRLLSKNLKTKIFRTIILPVVLYGCETRSLTSREECRLRVFKDRELRRIFGLKRDEVTKAWIKLHNEELNDLFSSPYIFRVMKSRKIRQAGNVVHMGERRGVYGIWVEKLEERVHLEDPGVDGRIIIRWIFRKWDVGVWTGSSWLRIGTGGVHL